MLAQKKAQKRSVVMYVDPLSLMVDQEMKIKQGDIDIDIDESKLF